MAVLDPFANYSHTGRLSKLKRAVGKPMKKLHMMFHSPTDNFVLSSVWILSSILTVLIPLVYRTIHAKKYRKTYLQYYWQQEYEEYEEQRQQNYQQYGNGNQYYWGEEGEGEQEYNEAEYQDVNRCKWYNLNCFSFFVNREGEAMANQEWAPTWYSGFITTEEEREMMQNTLEQPGSLKFVYIWQIVMFAVIGYYGLKVINQNRSPTGLIIALLVWANFAFLSMWLMADGSIATEGQVVKRMGFYGQMSVLIFMTNFWYFVHGLAFVIVFWLRSSCVTDRPKVEKEETKAQDGSYNAPAVTE